MSRELARDSSVHVEAAMAMIIHYACMLEFALPVQHDLVHLIRVKTPRPESLKYLMEVVSIQHL